MFKKNNVLSNFNSILGRKIFVARAFHHLDKSSESPSHLVGMFKAPGFLDLPVETVNALDEVIDIWK